MSLDPTKAAEAAVSEVRDLGRQSPTVYAQTLLILSGLFCALTLLGTLYMHNEAERRWDALFKSVSDESTAAQRELYREMMARFVAIEDRAEKREERTQRAFAEVERSIAKLAFAVERLNRANSPGAGPFAPGAGAPPAGDICLPDPALVDLDPERHAGGPDDSVVVRPGDDAADDHRAAVVAGRRGAAPEHHGRRPDRGGSGVPLDLFPVDFERRRHQAELDELARVLAAAALDVGV
jgi:hypothetical protein